MTNILVEGAETLAVSEMSAPCLVLDVDIVDTFPDLPPPGLGGARCAWMLVRFRSEPLGTLIVGVPRRGLDSAELLRLVMREFGSKIDDGSPHGDSSTTRSTHAIEDGPKIAVVVCTRERPEGLERCLGSLLEQSYPRLHIVVVDNAPTSDDSKVVAARFSHDQVTYVVEPAPGLSWARNRGIRSTDADVIAWIDDDEIADPNWIAEIARAFRDHPSAAAVSGIMLPAELETWSQVRFEQYGGHSKHRGFQAAVFSPDTRRTQHPLYPLPPFGTGGNMAFRREALLRFGGFDPALGAGSPAMGGEDTKIFSEILGDGGTIVYHPFALTFHFHRRDEPALERQMLGYGVGLTAFYTSILMSHPKLVRDAYRLIPSAWRDLLGRGSLRSGHLPPDFPTALRKANRKGLLLGPGRYLKERWRLRRRVVSRDDLEALEVSHGA